MDIDVKPVHVDRLVAFPADALQARRAQLEMYVESFNSRVTVLQEELEEAQRIYTFVVKELENALLAQDLAKGDKVRVVCPQCQGSGMRPADVTSGRVAPQTIGNAFEGLGGPAQAPQITDRNKCKECQGARWVIMDRFRG